jgi:hypothetical protein
MRCVLLGVTRGILCNPRALSTFLPLRSSFPLFHKRGMSTEAHKHKNQEEVEQSSAKKQKMETLPTPQFSDKITLTEEEKHIFDTLLDVVKTSGCGSVLRVAGGWVRDKVNRHTTNTQYAIRNTQYAIRNTQYAIRNTQYAIRNTQYAIRNAIRNTQYATQHVTRNTQHATQYATQHVTRNTQHATQYATRHAIRNAQYTTARRRNNTQYETNSTTRN